MALYYVFVFQTSKRNTGSPVIFRLRSLQNKENLKFCFNALNAIYIIDAALRLYSIAKIIYTPLREYTMGAVVF